VRGYAAFSAEVDERKWYAVYTVPNNERSVARHLEFRRLETFLPTYESTRLWKNRQKVKVTAPLFPTYLFVRIERNERGRVLDSPGVLRILGNSKGPLPVSSADIEFLQSDLCRRTVEPYRELVIGQKVRIRSGAMQGVEGVLVRKKNGMKFVVTLALINQHAALEVHTDELEPLLAEPMCGHE
jgi:transcription antitermination factor NusG